jgi:alkylhydroperoxidase/carboxymuconolactone decarboxylase family protein YurZ
MDTDRKNQLTDKEKTLISMGAAMGGGCRTCADKLYNMAVTQDIPKAEMLQAFLLGLEAKAQAVKTMQDKVFALLAEGKAAGAEGLSPKLSFLIRIASFTAANSAPDCLAQAAQAQAAGITAEQLQLGIATGKMVRKHATEFSDGEISGKFDCSAAGEKAKCCPGPGNAEISVGCSCG